MGQPLELNPNTNPIYVQCATHNTDGAMSSEDKIKLDALPAPDTDTLQGVYDRGVLATNQTMSIAAAKGGAVIVKAAGAATGSLFKALTSAAATLVDFTDNASQTIKSAVVDGVSAVGFIVDSANELGTGTIASFRTAGIEKLSLVWNAAFTSTYLRGSEFFLVLSSGGSGIYGSPNSLNLFINEASIISVGLASFSPQNNLAIQLGSSSKIYTEMWSRRVAGVQRNISAVATITLNTALGSVQRIALSATAITTINGSAGYPGELMVVEVIQDGAGGKSISGWSTGTNGFLLAGGSYTPTATLNKRDVLTFVWDETTVKWVECARSMNC